MSRETKITIGLKGVNSTTHCLMTGRPIKKGATNYSLGDNYYVSVNVGQALTAAQVNQIAVTILPAINPEEPETKEEIEYDNID